MNRYDDPSPEERLASCEGVVRQLEADIERLKAEVSDQARRLIVAATEVELSEARLAAWKRAIYETAEVWGPGSSKIVSDWIAEVERRAALAAAQPKEESQS